MQRPPRLILCDLDGTLLGPDRTIHPENVRVLRALMAQGVKFAFATGRSPGSVAPYVALLKPNAPLVHMNGALVRDFNTGAVIAQHALTVETAMRAIAVARAHGFHVNVYVGTEIWIDVVTETSRESEMKDGVAHTSKGDVIDALHAQQVGPIKLMNIGAAAHIAHLTRALTLALGEENAALVNSEPTYLEVLPFGCSKLTAARALCEHLGISLAETMAFGDNLNDLELLEGVGVGVAMANSHETVLARVPHHCGAHDTDAIARFLAGYFPL